MLAQRSNCRLFFIGGALTAALALTACGAGNAGNASTDLLPLQAHRSPDNHRDAERVYVSAYGQGRIYCYTAAGRLFGTIHGLATPQGEAVTKDSRHDVVVADSAFQHVSVYQGTCGQSRVRIMNDATGFPSGIAADAAGNVYVTNIFDRHRAAGEVREYAPGDNTGVQIGDPNLSEAYFIAVDAKGDLFVDGFDNRSSPTGRVDWRGPKSTTWRNTGILLIFPGGIQVDASGNVVVRDQDAGFATYEFPGFTPTGTSFPCPNPLGCDDFSFNADGTQLWTADARLGDVYEIAYPSGTLLKTIANVGGGGTKPAIIDSLVIPGL